MSRSKRKTFEYSITCAGFNRGIKKDKIRNNQNLRSKTKQILRICEDYDNLILPEKLEDVMERWDYRDDGRWRCNLEDIFEFKNPWRYLYK